MENIIFNKLNKRLLLTSHLLLAIVVSQAQWQADVRLTNNTANSSTTGYSNARCIASSGDTVHVVWRDNRDGGNYEIYYKHSIDGGFSWGSDTRLSNNIFFSSNPSVSVSGPVVLVVWDDNRDGNKEIYYNRSTDGGTTWGTDSRLTNDPAASENPCVSISGSVAHVIWDDNRNGPQIEIYYKRSTDGGLTWGADTRMTNDSAGSWQPSVSTSGSVVHVVWSDSRNGHHDIYYKRSTDGGLNLGVDTPLTNDTIIKNNPSVSIADSVVFVIWMDSRDRYPNYEIYYKRSTDGGITWGADTRLTTNYTSATLFSTSSVSGSVVHVVWDDNRDGNYEIYYKRSTDGGTTWGADTRLTNNTSVSVYPFVSVSGPVVHVVWQDLRDGNFEIYYKQDPTGSTVVPTNRELANITIGSGTIKCFNALQTITVAGNGTNFTVQNGGYVTLIAGLNIIFLPGTTVQPGGYLWGYITTNGTYCVNPGAPFNISSISKEVEIVPETGTTLFRVYPNPGIGRFTLELLNEPLEKPAIVKIYNMMNSQILETEIPSGRVHELSLDNQGAGIYFIKVVQNNEVGIGKVIKK